LQRPRFSFCTDSHLTDLPSGHTILIGGQPVKLPVERVLRLIALGVSLAIAVATGASMMAEWSALALFWYAPRATDGVVDPILGSIVRTGKEANGLIAGNEFSSVNRAVAFYRYLVGVPATQEPPGAR
jgi:hypothetical protein